MNKFFAAVIATFSSWKGLLFIIMTAIILPIGIISITFVWITDRLEESEWFENVRQAWKSSYHKRIYK